MRTINSTCANPKALWAAKLGSPTWPSESQLRQLKLASSMCEESVPVSVDAAGVRHVELMLEAYASAELVLE